MVTRIAKLLRGRQGFTLIELLVVVAIIALLAAFAVPRLFEAINKSKKAPGDADMQTLSSALERYYFDNNEYPSGNAQAVSDALKGTYVKTNTTFVNGFKHGYIYFTDADGSFYILVDPQNNADNGNVTVRCGNWTSSTVAITDAFESRVEPTAPSADDLKAGCQVQSASGVDPAKTTVITN